MREVLLRYLAVAHFGRGRGEWVEGDVPRRWTVAVEEALHPRRHELERILSLPEDASAERRERLAALLGDALRATLKALYPSAARALGD